MSRLCAFRIARIRAGAASAIAVLTLASASVSAAQGAPPPSRFVPQLDLKCYKVESSVPSLDLKLRLSHLNPVFQSAGLPSDIVVVRRLEQLCVPVAKDNLIPDPEVLRFIQFVDLACYGIETSGTPPNLQVRLSHLNPLLQKLGAPDELVFITTPKQLCLPVAKNNAELPPDVLRLVQLLDLQCYDFATHVQPLNIHLRLSHLNRVLVGLGMQDERVRVTIPQQLCVPVAKNDLFPPHDLFNLVKYTDLKKYAIEAAPLPAPVTLVLRHLNPLLQNRVEKVALIAPTHLMLPVAKDGKLPEP